MVNTGYGLSRNRCSPAPGRSSGGEASPSGGETRLAGKIVNPFAKGSWDGRDFFHRGHLHPRRHRFLFSPGENFLSFGERRPPKDSLEEKLGRKLRKGRSVPVAGAFPLHPDRPFACPKCRLPNDVVSYRLALLRKVPAAGQRFCPQAGAEPRGFGCQQIAKRPADATRRP